MCSICLHNVSSVTPLFSDKANVFALPSVWKDEMLQRRGNGLDIFACRLVGAKFEIG